MPVVIIQPDLANCHHLWLGGKITKLLQGMLVIDIFTSFMRMQANTCPDIVITSSKLWRRLAIRQATAHHNHASDTLFLGTDNNLLWRQRIIAKLNMAVGIKKLH